MNSWSSQWLYRPADARSFWSAGSASPSLYFPHFCATVRAASYGAYVKVLPKTRYQVILRIRTPGSPSPVEARFDHTF